MKNKDIDWIIHGVIGDEYIGGMCDMHSHGLNKYGSRELQVVLCAEEYAAIINKVGLLIKNNGVKLHAGMFIENLFDDDALLRIDDAVDCNGEPIWRLIIPDVDYKFPEESDEYPYFLQTYSPLAANAKDNIKELIRHRGEDFHPFKFKNGERVPCFKWMLERAWNRT